MVANKSNSSIFKGIWFQFEIENGVKVSVHCLPTGKEMVYVGDALVSQKYTVISGVHNFSANNKNYTINTGHGKNIIMGDIFCSLFENGEHLATEEQAFFQSKGNLWFVLLVVVLAFIFGHEIGHIIGEFMVWMKS